MKEKKSFWGQLLEIADKKLQEMNEKEAQRIQTLNEQNRTNIENAKSVALRKRWASALNFLPAHMRISCNEIYSHSLSNTYNISYWELHVPLQDSFSRSKCKGLHEQLTEILKNQFQEARQEFEQKLINDSIEYAEQLCIVSNGGLRTKEDTFFSSNYIRFFNAYCYRLVNIEIIDIDCIESKLHIQYKIDESPCQYFQSINYWNLLRFYM